PLALLMHLTIRCHFMFWSSLKKLAQFIVKCSDTDYILFVDSDIVFTPDDVVMLLEERKPIISGLCLGKNENGVFPVGNKVRGKAAPEVRMITKEECDGRVIELASVGMGFTLIGRKVFEDLG